MIELNVWAEPYEAVSTCQGAALQPKSLEDVGRLGQNQKWSEDVRRLIQVQTLAISWCCVKGEGAPLGLSISMLACTGLPGCFPGVFARTACRHSSIQRTEWHKLIKIAKVRLLHYLTLQFCQSLLHVFVLQRDKWNIFLSCSFHVCLKVANGSASQMAPGTCHSLHCVNLFFSFLR